MKKFGVKKTILCVIVLILIVSGWWTAKLIWMKPLNINHFHERVFIEFALKNPELLSQLRILERWGLGFHNNDLTDASDAFMLKVAKKTKKNLAILRSYERRSQSPAQLLSTDILDWYLDDVVRGQTFMYHRYPVDQLFGVQTELPLFMSTTHQINKKKDAKNYITRLSKFGVKFDQVLEGLKTREQKGIIPPRFVIERVLDEMRGFVGEDIHNNVLYTSFREKIEKVEDIDDKDRQKLYLICEGEIKDTVYPAYQRLVSYFEYLEPIATTDDGVWRLPDGNAYYIHALRSHTTLDVTPEQVHSLGLKEVERIQNEMRIILDSLGYTGRNIAEYMKDFSKEERFLYPDTDSGKAQCLADYQAIIDDIDQNLPDIFDIPPKIDIAVERFPAFKEKTAPWARYEMPPLDGSRPGIFYVNLRNMNEIPKYEMKTTAYHETIPGHHSQFSIQRKMKGVPTFRKVVPFMAYIEGWGLYAEKLAWEYGFHKEPYSNLGRLQAELFRAVRLVVDTGIHHKRWTREDAIAYMEQNTGMPTGDVVTEIERYIVYPGQACAYKMGELKILELRDKAKSELGDKFNIKEFHNVILQDGAMPLDLLEKVVQEYIASL